MPDCTEISITSRCRRPIQFRNSKPAARSTRSTTASRSVLAATWPIIAPTIDRSIDEVIDGVIGIADRSERVAPHRESIVRLELAHFQALLGGNLDQRYAEIVPAHRRARGCDRARRAHPQLRPGTSCSEAALDALARKHRFSPDQACRARQGRIAGHQLRRRQRHDAAPAGGGTGGARAARRDRRRDRAISTAPSAKSSRRSRKHRLRWR